MTGSRLAVAAAAVAAVLVGASMVATRVAIAETEPASLALLRYVIGSLCLVPAVLFSGWVRIGRRHLLPIALLGIGQFGVLIALLNVGLQYIDSALAALIFSTLPLLTMTLAAALGLERLTSSKALGVLVTIFGVAMALGERLSDAGVAGAAWQGALYVVAATLTGAICAVFYRPYLRGYPPLQVGALAMVSSVLFLAALAAGEGFFSAPPRFSDAAWLAILFIGVSSGVGYFLWLWALKHTTPTRVTVLMALSPITAAALGAALLSEPLSLSLIIGLIAVIAGLWLAHRPGQRQKTR